MERWERINTAAPDAARAELQICCGSRRWIDRMMARVPFASREAACEAAREEWFALEPADWREAFDHHPRIGSRVAPESGAASALSAREQSGVAGATSHVRQALAAGNRDYEERFGFIYLVCATGKSADDMLQILQSRLSNDADTEIRIAAEEHAKICALRLAAPV